MKRIQVSMSLLLLAGVMGYTPIAIAASAADPHKPKGLKPGVLSAVALDRDGSYCHMRFPAIIPRTLTSDKPQLRPPTSEDIIDFYGPCDTDPLGKDQINAQKRQWEERNRDNR